MLREFIAGFLHALEEDLSPPKVPEYKYVPSRPSRKEMKRNLLEALKNYRTQYRFSMKIRENEYHAIYYYDRGAVYTLTYEWVGRRRNIPKLVTVHNGKASKRDMLEDIRHRVAERDRRAQQARIVAELSHERGEKDAQVDA